MQRSRTTSKVRSFIVGIIVFFGGLIASGSDELNNCLRDLELKVRVPCCVQSTCLGHLAHAIVYVRYH